MNWLNTYRTTEQAWCAGCGVELQPNTLVRWQRWDLPDGGMVAGVFHIWCARENAPLRENLRDRPGRVTAMCPQP